MVGHTWVTSCIVGVCWTAGVMSASTVGAPPAHRRVHIVVLDAQINGGILLANSKVPKFVYPTCLLGRQKSLGNLRKKKYC